MDGIKLSGTRRLAIISMFSALAIGTDYAMLPLANIKLMDSIVFVSAIAFGVSAGASVAALTWLVYGTVNPLGPDSGGFLLLLIVSELVYVAFGFLARKLLNPEHSLPVRSILWGSFGLIGAFLYDINTIVTPYLIIGQSLGVSLAELLPAIPFMLAHEVSDFVFFATVAPALYAASRKVLLRQGQYSPPQSSARPLEPKNI